VQTALNRKIKAGLTVDGKCGPATIKAIMDVQKGLGKFKPDGLVEPGRGTARFLASTTPLGLRLSHPVRLLLLNSAKGLSTGRRPPGAVCTGFFQKMSASSRKPFARSTLPSILRW
jgi:hypothetical protein